MRAPLSLLLCAAVLLCTCNLAVSRPASSLRGAASDGNPKLLDHMRQATHLTTFVRVIQAAGLEDMFLKEHEYATVLAPTNHAFRHVNVDRLLQHPHRCQKLVKYHTIVGGYYADTLLGKELNTNLEGASALRFTRDYEDGSSVRVWGAGNSALLVAADTMAWNGWLHSIDHVLEFEGHTLGERLTLGGPRDNVMALMENLEFLDTWVSVIKAAGLTDLFTRHDDAKVNPNHGPFVTALAPVNRAFRNVDVKALLKDTERCRQLVLYHTLEHLHRSDELRIKSTPTFKVATLLKPHTVTFRKGWVISNRDLRVSNEKSESLSYGQDWEASNGSIQPFHDLLELPGDSLPKLGAAGSDGYDDLYDVLQRSTALTTFTRIVEESGMVEELRKLNFRTVFAPSNQAFEKLGKAWFEKLLQDKPRMARLVKYHTVFGLADVDLMYLMAQKLQTLLPGAPMLTASYDYHTKVFTVFGASNAANIVALDLFAYNGLVQIVDSVLELPEGPKLGASVSGPDSGRDLFDMISTPSYLSTFAKIVVAAGMDDELRSSEAMTVLAPADSAFDKLGQAWLQSLMADRESMRLFVQYHLVEGVMDSEAIIEQAPVNVISYLPYGSELTLVYKDESFTVHGGSNAATLVSMDNYASNGVLHVLNNALELPEGPKLGVSAQGPDGGRDLFEMINTLSYLSTFAKIVVESGMVGELHSSDTKTLLAPINSAFEKLGQPWLNNLLADKERLRRFVKYHLTNGAVDSEAIIGQAPLKVKSRLVSELTLSYNDESFVVFGASNAAMLVSMDNYASNGVLHVLNNALELPEGPKLGVSTQGPDSGRDLFDMIRTPTYLSTFTKIVVGAGMVDELRSSQAMTVLAPIDSAFEKLGQAWLNSLLADRERMRRFVKYHMIMAAVDSEVMIAGAPLKIKSRLLYASELTLSYNDESFVVFGASNAAMLVSMDNYASNGVLHVLNNALELPDMPKNLQAIRQ